MVLDPCRDLGGGGWSPMGWSPPAQNLLPSVGVGRRGIVGRCWDRDTGQGEHELVGMDRTWTCGAGEDIGWWGWTRRGLTGLAETWSWGWWGHGLVGTVGRWAGGAAGHGQAGTHLLALLLALSPQHLAVAELVLEQVLLGGGEEQPLGVQRPDDVVPDGAALPVVAAHSPRHVLSDHLREYGGLRAAVHPSPRGTRRSPLQ